MRKWKILLAASLAATFFGGLAGAADISGALPAPAAQVKVPSYTAAQKARYEKLRQVNEGLEAPKERFLTTTAQKVVLTFGGLTKKEAVEDMLTHLDAMGAKATFFVTELELRKYPDVVSEIISRGHEIGLGLRTGTEGDFYETCAQIERLQKNLSARFGVRPVIARQVFGSEKPEVNEACSAMDVTLLGQTVNLVQTKDKEARSAEEIYANLFGKSILALGRGQIIYGRLDYVGSPDIVGNLLELVKRDKVDSAAYRTFTDSPEGNPANDSAYHFASAGEILSDTAHLWEYPLKGNRILYGLHPDEPIDKVTERNFMTEMRKRYIGAPSVNAIDRVQGFSATEIKQIDQTGLVKSVVDNTIFLTFDDWSTDCSLNHLLYVLRKHKTKGTFFIITWNVKNNPNLLRSIAAEGHEIASHTNGHRPMVKQTSNYGGNMTPMSETEYAEDVKVAYRELAYTVGDMIIDGRPALTRFLRPPTLAISRSGMKAIFNAGYTYSVSGYESTDDYAAPSLQTMIGAIQHGLYDEKGNVRKGSILIMHMTDSAKYTAEALDYVLTVNEERDDNDPKKFKVGLLADYLTDDYDQSMTIAGDFEKGLSYKGSCGH